MDSNYCSWGDGAGAGRDREEAGYFSEELRSEVAWADTLLGSEQIPVIRELFLQGNLNVIGFVFRAIYASGVFWKIIEQLISQQ